MHTSPMCTRCLLRLQLSRLRLSRAGRGPCISRFSSTSQQHVSSQPQPAVGRYSREPLRPQDILRQIDAKDAHGSKNGAGSSPNVGGESSRPRELSNPWDVRKEDHDDPPLAALKIIAHVVRLLREKSLAWAVHRLAALLPRLPERKPLTADAQEILGWINSRPKGLKAIIRYTINNRLYQLSGGSTLTHQLPRTSNIIRALHKVHLLTGPSWRFIFHTYLFTLTLRIAGGHTWDPRFGGEEEAISDLMRLWELRLRLSLNRGDDAALDGRPDWSFIPSVESIAEALEGDRREFDRSFQMLIPTDRPGHRTMADGGQEIMKLSTAALLTHYILTERLNSRQDTKYASMQESRPFADLIATLRKYSNDDTPLVFEKLLEKHPDSNQALTSHFDRMREALGLGSGTKTPKPSHPEQTMIPPKTERIGLDAPARERTRSDASDMEATQSNAPDLRQLDTSSKAPPQSSTVIQDELFSGYADESDMLSEPAKRFSELCIKRIGRALEYQRVTHVRQIFMEVEKFQMTDRLPLKLYEFLLYSTLVMRIPDVTAATLKAMSTAKCEPTVRTFTVLMKGSHKARDIDAVENAWRAMRANGLQPDAHAWSTRVFALFGARKVRAGLQALYDMGHEWYSAAKAKKFEQLKENTKRGATKGKPARLEDVKISLQEFPGDVDGVPRPSIVTANSAITVLTTYQFDLVQEVLQWSRTFDIEPDRVTYNALLNGSMAAGKLTDALEILQRMRTKGFEPDGETMTVILAALFKQDFLGGLDPEQQQKRIMDFVHLIGSTNGSKGHQKSYALIVDRMLKQYSNPAAARQVLSHMRSKGLPVSTYIYTILISYYFSQDPPDLATVSSVWEEVKHGSNYGIPADNYFYDRLIEGYAQNHTVLGPKPMLEVMLQASKEGKTPSWVSLLSVARALAERGEWDRLAGIVEDIRHRRDMGISLPNRRGQWEFWQFIIETGLLRDEGIEDPDQMIVRRVGHLGHLTGYTARMEEEANTQERSPIARDDLRDRLAESEIARQLGLDGR